MGATERVGLDRLVSEFGAEVKIQYDAVRTRLHAKAWLFQRNTGFHTAYVGSSNLSRSALLGRGVERAALGHSDSTADAEVLRNVRHLLERPDLLIVRRRP